MYAEGKTPSYARIVVDFRPQQLDPNRVRITASGNLIKCSGKLTTRTADIATTIIIWNSVISTEGARYRCLNVGDFYLETPIEKNGVHEDAIGIISRMDTQAIQSRHSERLRLFGKFLGNLWTTQHREIG